MVESQKKFQLQDSLYAFPYHYLPMLDKDHVFRLHRQLPWGLDYMTYMSFITDLISNKKPRKLCDVGCGDGRLINMVQSIVPDLTGVDLSERAIAFARAFNPDAKIICDNINNLSDSYDWVTLIEVLEHIPDNEMEHFLANVTRLIKKNGYLLITVPTINIPTNKKHYRHYDLKLLETTLQPLFDIEAHWWVYRQGVMEKIERNLICNTFFVLNNKTLLKFIWMIHKRLTYYANQTNGTHLVCLAKPKGNGDVR